MACAVNLSVCLLAAVSVQSQQLPASPLLVDVLVFGTHLTVDRAEYSREVRDDLESYLRRARGYRSARPMPVSRDLQMVHSTQVNYERLLVAITAPPGAAKPAAGYVDALRPCYEWEGFAECPEREAQFADRYAAANPGSPFAEYLPLLSAHRWLCAAEGYDYEKAPGDAARSRQNYEQRLAIAGRSQNLLVRTAAMELSVRRRCRAT